MRATIASGELGSLKTLIVYANGTLFNTATHWFDLLSYLNGDAAVQWVQAYLPNGDDVIVGNQITADPEGQGTIAFANGVMAHVLLSSRPFDLEAICEQGTVSASRQDSRFEMRRLVREGRSAHLSEPELLSYVPSSSTLHLIEDLVQALNTGAPTRGGVRVARINTDIIFGFVESQRRGGSRVALPLRESDLRFVPRNNAPKQPRYAP
jgi:predicted dehydrogenase